MTPAAFFALFALSAPAHFDGHDDDADRTEDRAQRAAEQAAREQRARHDAEEERDERVVESCPRAVLDSFARLDDAMRHMDAEIAATRGNGGHREHMREDMIAVAAAAQQARVASCRAARRESHVVVVPQPPPRPVIRVLDDVSAHELVTAVRTQPFDDGRLSVLELGVRSVCVTTHQAEELVEELTFSRPRLDALRTLAPRIVDRNGAFKILDAFTFESDKRAAKDILTSTAPAPDCDAALLSRL